MKLLTLIFTLVIFIVTSTANAQMKGYYATGEKKFEIDTANGMLNGRFRLWSKNGEKKFEGNFKNNRKHRTWTVWDSLKRVRVKYKFAGGGDYDFKMLTFNNIEGKAIKRLNKTGFLQQRYMDSITRDEENGLYWSVAKRKTINADSLIAIKKLRKMHPEIPRARTVYGYEEYTETRDSAGLLLYPRVGDEDIFTAIKMYRFVEPSALNAPLFDAATILGGISNYTARQKSPEIYSTSEFIKKIDPESVPEKMKCIENISGYKIIEVWYFDKRRMNSSTRILGICPVVFNEASQKYEDVFWIYYPAFREILAKKAINLKGNAQIQTLEDILHYRQFSSFVYFREHATEKEENIDIYKDLKKLKQESVEMEALPLMAEYAAMLNLTVAPLFQATRLSF